MIAPAWLRPVGILLVVACGGNDASSPAPEPGSGPVTVDDNFFQPAQLTVTRVNGTVQVTWNWSGTNLHNVTFDAGPPHSETQRSGSFSRDFSQPGSFTYICTVHGRALMSGTVNVE
jgi:plastocyanin